MVTMDISLPVLAMAKSYANQVVQDIITDAELEAIKEKLEEIDD